MAEEGPSVVGEETLLAWFLCKPAGAFDRLVDGAETLLIERPPDVLAPVAGPPVCVVSGAAGRV